MEDGSYVEKVLDAELACLSFFAFVRTDSEARTVLLDDIASSSIFFFLDPKYDSHEASSMIDQRKLLQFGKSYTISCE